MKGDQEKIEEAIQDLKLDVEEDKEKKYEDPTELSAEEDMDRNFSNNLQIKRAKADSLKQERDDSPVNASSQGSTAAEST